MPQTKRSIPISIGRRLKFYEQVNEGMNPRMDTFSPSMFEVRSLHAIQWLCCGSVLRLKHLFELKHLFTKTTAVPQSVALE